MENFVEVLRLPERAARTLKQKNVQRRLFLDDRLYSLTKASAFSEALTLKVWLDQRTAVVNRPLTSAILTIQGQNRTYRPYV